VIIDFGFDYIKHSETILSKCHHHKLQNVHHFKCF